MKDIKAIRNELARVEKAIDGAKADVASRTAGGTIYAYWEKPLPDVSRLEGHRDALRWVLD
jgi:hypothetical protein